MNKRQTADRSNPGEPLYALRDRLETVPIAPAGKRLNIAVWSLSALDRRTFADQLARHLAEVIRRFDLIAVFDKVPADSAAPTISDLLAVLGRPWQSAALPAPTAPTTALQCTLVYRADAVTLRGQVTPLVPVPAPTSTEKNVRRSPTQHRLASALVAEIEAGGLHCALLAAHTSAEDLPALAAAATDLRDPQDGHQHLIVAGWLDDRAPDDLLPLSHAALGAPVCLAAAAVPSPAYFALAPATARLERTGGTLNNADHARPHTSMPEEQILQRLFAQPPVWLQLRIDIGSGMGNRYLPAFDPDVAKADQRDLLDIGLDVNAMSALAATRDIEPPLSIGLFGDWGSGKTFFMEKMYTRVESIAQKSASKRFCQGIVQIRFNAWHYVESNLWASIIDTIFRQLEAAVRDNQDGEARLEALRSQLRSAMNREQAARRDLENIEKRLHEAERKRNEVAQAKQQAEDRAYDLRSSALPTVDQEAYQQIKDLLGAVERDVGIQDLPKPQGVGQTTIAEAVELLSDARLLRSRSSQLWQAVVNSTLTWRQWLAMGIAAVSPVIITALLAFIHTEPTSDFATTLKDWLAQPLLIVAEIATLVGTAIRWTRSKMRQASESLDRVDAKRRELTVERDAEVAKRRDELERIEVEIARLTEDCGRKEREVAAIAAQAEETRRQLKELSPVRRMARFLSERAASDDYRQHLGLVAMIRQDLEQLSQLLALQRGQPRDQRLPAIERIILYIDDLDRCPPQRVVELLQAVHLLLAFPLFVVVVAVDVRWISRSLVQYYPELLDQTPDSNSNQATSHDYLEKIFQIPFWIQPLTATSSADMLAGLLPRSRPQPALPATALDREASNSAAATPPVSDTPPRTLADPTSRVDPADTSASDAPTTEPAVDRQRDEVPFNPERLEIHDQERAVMLTLGSYIGRSPRAIKRFVNIYRLLKAGLSEYELRRFEPDSTGNGLYKASLLALAILIGYPRIADDVFDAIRESPEPGLTEQRQGADAWIAQLCAGEPAQRDNADWRDLVRAVVGFCRRHPVDSADLRACVPRVARYSFRHL